MENLTEFARKRLEEIKGFISANNYKVLNVENHYCEMEGIITETSMNNLNIVHGGYIFGLADTTAAIAAMTEGEKVVTVDSNINYLKPAKSSKLFAKASPIKLGKTISVYEVLISDENSNLIAKATITYFAI